MKFELKKYKHLHQDIVKDSGVPNLDKKEFKIPKIPDVGSSDTDANGTKSDDLAD